MRYTLLGNSGLRVSEVALGTMTFGTDWGWGHRRPKAPSSSSCSPRLAVTLIDTANKYTNGTAESILGDLLATDRDHFVVGTKYSLNVHDGDLNAGGNHRKSLVQALEASLQRLRTDHIDILWLHAWDYLTPPEEVMRSLDDSDRPTSPATTACDSPRRRLARAIRAPEVSASSFMSPPSGRPGRATPQ